MGQLLKPVQRQKELLLPNLKTCCSHACSRLSSLRKTKRTQIQVDERGRPSWAVIYQHQAETLRSTKREVRVKLSFFLNRKWSKKEPSGADRSRQLRLSSASDGDSWKLCWSGWRPSQRQDSIRGDSCHYTLNRSTRDQ